MARWFVRSAVFAEFRRKMLSVQCFVESRPHGFLVLCGFSTNFWEETVIHRNCVYGVIMPLTKKTRVIRSLPRQQPHRKVKVVMKMKWVHLIMRRLRHVPCQSLQWHITKKCAFVLGWRCTCKVGLRTVGCCSHVAAVLIQLGCLNHGACLLYTSPSPRD